MDNYFDLIDISFEGCSLQMSPSQLTTTNIAKLSDLCPTVTLVSDRGTVALPTDRIFDMWMNVLLGLWKVTKR